MKDKLCPDCGMPIRLRNPSGHCDHLYYPENLLDRNGPKLYSHQQMKEIVDEALTSQKERMVEMIDGMFGEDRNAPIVKEVVDDIIKKLEEL